MLPLIVIGWDDRTLKAISLVVVSHSTRLRESNVRVYESSEAAGHTLGNQLAAAVKRGYLDQDIIEFDAERNAWRANVAYGPRALDLDATRQPTKLPHTGWTLALTWSIADATVPRRVVDGTRKDRDAATLLPQVASILGANILIDLSVQDTSGVAVGLVNALSQMEQRMEP